MKISYRYLFIVAIIISCLNCNMTHGNELSDDSIRNIRNRDLSTYQRNNPFYSQRLRDADQVIQLIEKDFSEKESSKAIIVQLTQFYDSKDMGEFKKETTARYFYTKLKNEKSKNIISGVVLIDLESSKYVIKKFISEKDFSMNNQLLYSAIPRKVADIILKALEEWNAMPNESLEQDGSY